MLDSRDELLLARSRAQARLGRLLALFKSEAFIEVDRLERERMQREASLLGSLILVLSERISAMPDSRMEDPWYRKFLLRVGAAKRG